MPESYFSLGAGERRAILSAGAVQLGWPPQYVEKDIWICQALECLSTVAGIPAFVFKGGTSLSKVFRAIWRFSEDIDVTVDLSRLVPQLPLLSAASSRSEKDAVRKAVDEQLASLVLGLITPHLRVALRELCPNGDATVEVSDAGDVVTIHYPLATEQYSEYVAPAVKLEFGGRMPTSPAASHQIQPELMELTSKITFPTPTVSVLALERTYWEKITLIHFECQRNDPGRVRERLARHWYDLACLSVHPAGQFAANDRSLLERVVISKEIHFASGQVNYRDCLNGALVLIPVGIHATALEADYNAMRTAQMFTAPPPAGTTSSPPLPNSRTALTTRWLSKKRTDAGWRPSVSVLNCG